MTVVFPDCFLGHPRQERFGVTKKQPDISVDYICVDVVLLVDPVTRISDIAPRNHNLQNVITDLDNIQCSS